MVKVTLVLCRIPRGKFSTCSSSGLSSAPWPSKIRSESRERKIHSCGAEAQSVILNRCIDRYQLPHELTPLNQSSTEGALMLVLLGTPRLTLRSLFTLMWALVNPEPGYSRVTSGCVGRNGSQYIIRGSIPAFLCSKGQTGGTGKRLLCMQKYETV